MLFISLNLPYGPVWNTVVTLLFISLNLSYGLVWNTVVMSGVVVLIATMLDKLQKGVCRTNGFLLAAAIELLAYH